ncbi:MAG TPA: transcriptional repressor [Candidatus Acidoferrales bacterium]|nr:transcriptional repressor [Candidatus Acidoferrales bacterium]
MLNDLHQRKRSRQREKILEVVKSTKIHPTADWVFHEVRKEMPNISLATVYRNLNQLVESKDISEVLSDGQLHFDANKDDHFHFICRSCNGIFDIEEKRVESPDFKLPRGYKVESVKMDFYGVCPNCQAKE